MNDTLIEQIQADAAALDIKITAQEIALYLSEKKVPPEHLEAIKRFIASTFIHTMCQKTTFLKIIEDTVYFLHFTIGILIFAQLPFSYPVGTAVIHTRRQSQRYTHQKQ